MDFNINMEWQYTERDYQEDAHLENGNYVRPCFSCGENYISHKRWLVCRTCMSDMNSKLGAVIE